MTEEDNTKPQIPSVAPTPGWQTSQGQMTAIFTVVCIVLSFLGFHYTPEQFQGWLDRIEHIAVILGPILAIVPLLITYINSRGKIASNSLMANAQIKIAALQPLEPIGELGQARLAMFADRLTPIIGGNDWKDPHRYEQLLHIASDIGVPGVVQTNKINQQIHPADLITNILGMFRNKFKK